MKSAFVILFLLCYAVRSHAQHLLFFINKTGRPVLIQKRNILEEGAYPFTLEPDSLITQLIPLQLNEPVILNVTTIPPKGPYGSADGLYFLLKPGDSLIVRLNKLNEPVISHVSNSKRTEALNFFPQHTKALNIVLPYQLSGFKGNPSLNRQLRSNDIRRRDKILDSLYQPYIRSVKTFFANDSNNSDAEKWYNFYLGNLYADKLLAGWKTAPEFQQALQNFYKDSLAGWQQLLQCETCGNIPPFNNALQSIYTMQFQKLSPQAFMDTIAVLAKGNSKNLLLSKYVSQLLNNTNADSLLIQAFKQLCTDPLYVNHVLNNYLIQQQRMINFGKEVAVLLKIDKTETGFSQLIKRLAGKVVYIDFWASWCGPCIQELPHSKQLKEKIKNNNIEFLYISIDDDFNKWKQAAAKYQLTGDNSFMLPYADKTSLAVQIDLGAIPRYIIINKSGKIEELYAPAPSEEGVFEVLMKILNQ